MDQEHDGDRKQHPSKGPAPGESWWKHHPGFAESLIPVWGSGREALADLNEGHDGMAAVNGALAISDLFVAGEVAKGLAKGGFKLAGSNSWNATRKWMGKNKFLDAGEHGHHWLIPQKGWGEHVPDVVKNQPWNIKRMASPEVHGRIHGPYAGKPRYNPVQGAWFGTPTWSKVVGASDSVRTGLFSKKKLDEHVKK